MTLNVKSCAHWQLYCIVDRVASGKRDLAFLTDCAVRGGADAVQFRDKLSPAKSFIREAKRCLLIARKARIPFIINDRVDIACAVDADGVHLGQDDLSVDAARKIVGQNRLIGLSTHSLDQALKAHHAGVDYIGCGPIFSTPTKPHYRAVGTDLIQRIKRQFPGAVVCIGGINKDNAQKVLNAGASSIAVVRALCAAPDPLKEIVELKSILQKFDYANV